MSGLTSSGHADHKYLLQLPVTASSERASQAIDNSGTRGRLPLPDDSWSPLSSMFEIRRSAIDGKGIFARERIRARRKIGELEGERITLREARKRAALRRRIAIVELPKGGAIDASVRGNEFRYINHSCTPNAYIRIFGDHVEFYALRTIQRGEEVTCNYGETQHEGTLPCRCGGARCRQYL